MWCAGDGEKTAKRGRKSIIQSLMEQGRQEQEESGATHSGAAVQARAREHAQAASESDGERARVTDQVAWSGDADWQSTETRSHDRKRGRRESAFICGVWDAGAECVWGQ